MTKRNQKQPKKPVESMGAQYCSFKRAKHTSNKWSETPFESGIAVLINGEVWAIVDESGQRVPKTYDFNLHPESGCFDVHYLP